MSIRSISLRLLIASLLAALLAACGGVGSQANLRDSALYAYAGAIRWGHIDDAWSMVDPEYARQHPMTALERERFAQVEITGYQVKGSQLLSDSELVQRVEIRLVNRHTQVERTLEDYQAWRWDEAAKRWWLTTGLPDITASPR